MKRNLFFIVAAMTVTLAVRAQQSTSVNLFSGIRTIQNGNIPNHSLFYYDSTRTAEYFLQKSKNQRTSAWVILAGGTALSIVGIVGLASNTVEMFYENTPADTYAFLTVAGAGIALGSIPLFIASGRNYRKAATLSFKGQRIYIPQQNSVAFKSQPSISLIIPL
jgi:hypothetical protein